MRKGGCVRQAATLRCVLQTSRNRIMVRCGRRRSIVNHV